MAKRGARGHHARKKGGGNDATVVSDATFGGIIAERKPARSKHRGGSRWANFFGKYDTK